LDLERHGLKCVMFDIPGEPSIDALPRRKEIRELLHARFPAKSFVWLDEPPPTTWETSDGVHLTRHYSKEFATYIEQQILLMRG